MRASLPLAAAVLSLTACVPITQQARSVELTTGEVQFELSGPGGAALVVQVGINGQGPFPFVLDTGATVTCVDERLAAELELPEAAGTIAVGAGIGGAGTMRLVRLESVEVGDAAARGLHGCVLNLEAMTKAGLDIRGLLGLNFLKSYLVTIDFERSTVRLQPPGAAAPD